MTPVIIEPRDILFKFVSYRYKHEVVLNREKLKSATNDSSSQVYINDDLTRMRATLLFKARTQKRDKKINDAWTSDGRILIKDLANKIHPISNEQDLAKCITL